MGGICDCPDQGVGFKGELFAADVDFIGVAITGHYAATFAFTRDRVENVPEQVAAALWMNWNVSHLYTSSS